MQVIAELCKGSTADSDSVCLGSNPSSAARKKHICLQMCFFQLYSPTASSIASQLYSATPSDIRFASFGGEYNITAERSGAISLLRSKNITLSVSEAYH